MPKTRTIQTNGTAGEISPRLIGRVDVSRYANGLRTCENAIPLVHGGLRRRYGLRYLAAAKSNTTRARLIPFVFSRTQAFVLEFGDFYVRFFTAAGQVLSSGSPYEIVSPYPADALDDIRFVQGADTMFLVHPDYAPRKLVRYSNTSWVLTSAIFEVPANEEIGERPNTTLTLGATTGSGVAGTAAAACFEAADVGRQIRAGQGLATITAVGSSTGVTLTITEPFASVGPIAANGWKITESPKVEITPSSAGPVGGSVNVTATSAAWKNLAAQIHAGMFVEINGGLIELSTYSSTTVMSGVIRAVLSSTTAAPSGGWALRQSVWNSIDGYPQAVAFHEQRLLFAGSAGYPQTIWGSKTGIYYDFAEGTDDDDAYSFTIAASELNPIEHLMPLRQLAPLTYGGEFSLEGSNELPITPTNVRIRPQTSYGCGWPRPVRVGDEAIFVSRSLKKVRSMGYKLDRDAFNAPDVSILSEHITGDGLYELSFAQEPDQVIWTVRADGVAPTLSIDRDQDVIGWARQVTDGQFESMATIPTESGDVTFALVARNIGGTKRFVERFDTALQTDCAVTGTATVAQTVWTGLTHLNGKSCDVKADGVYQGRLTVSAGAVTLPRAATSIEVGLPYTTTIRTLPPIIPGAPAFGQGVVAAIYEVILRLYQSIGGKVDGVSLPARQFGAGVLDAAPQPYTGDRRIEARAGWGRIGSDEFDGSITITQDQPYPFQVLAIIKGVSVND